MATAHLNAINRPAGPKPRNTSFSYGRALQDAALEAGHGREENQSPARRPCIVGPAATGRAVSEPTPTRWMRDLWSLAARSIAASGTTTDARLERTRARVAMHSSMVSEPERR